MKLPNAPKPLDELLDEHREHLPKLVQTAFHPTVNERYVHWDTLRHLDPPGGLDHEQWWVGIKLSRFGDLRRLPLCDAGGRPFTYTLPGRVQDALHRIDRRASGWVGTSEPVVNEGVRDRFIINSLIDEAVTSSQLEGASTTRSVAAEMIRAGRRPRDRSERMILNNYRAMQDGSGHAGCSADPRCAAESACDRDGRHARRFERRRTHADTGGRACARMGSPGAPPPPYAAAGAEQLPERMEALIRFANQNSADGPFLHPVVRAIAIHFWLAYDHPFEDGNGRTARALFYWAMLRDRYWMCEFISISGLL